jgi:hypothetical protein
LRQYGEGILNASRSDRKGKAMVVKRIRESSPLWVWLAVVLLFVGALAYVVVVSLMEYIMAAAT